MSGNKKGKGGTSADTNQGTGWDPVAIVYADAAKDDGYRNVSRYSIQSPHSEMVCTVVVPNPETDKTGEITRTENGVTLKHALSKESAVKLFNALNEWKFENSVAKGGDGPFGKIDWKKLGKNRIIAENTVTASDGTVSQSWELYPNVPANPIAAQCADQTPPSKGR